MLTAMRREAGPTAGGQMAGQGQGGGHHKSKDASAADRRTPKLGGTPNWLHNEGDGEGRGAAQPPRAAGDRGTNAEAAAVTAAQASERNGAHETKPGKATHSKVAKRRVKKEEPAAAEAVPKHTPKQNTRVCPL